MFLRCEFSMNSAASTARDVPRHRKFRPDEVLDGYVCMMNPTQNLRRAVIQHISGSESGNFAIHCETRFAAIMQYPF